MRDAWITGRSLGTVGIHVPVQILTCAPSGGYGILIWPCLRITCLVWTEEQIVAYWILVQ